MMQLYYRLVDVFGARPFAGNPLAVVSGPGAAALDTAQMQAMARWFNLSETAFLLPPDDGDADYRVRIFTLEHELPFAGHPTLGSAHAWLAMGGVPQVPGRIVQQCGAGLISITDDGGHLAFAAPPLRRSGPVAAADLAEATRLAGITPDDVVDAAWVDNGPGWLGIRLASATEVLAARPARAHHSSVAIGLVGPHPAGHDVAFEVRAFFTDHHGAIIEDPVTGSLNASLAQWLFASGQAAGGYVAAQGTAIGREGRIFVTQADDGAAWIGGAAVTISSGPLTQP